jgi:hypothetical protein
MRSEPAGVAVGAQSVLVCDTEMIRCHGTITAQLA